MKFHVSNCSHAKHLIGDTIRRNASPVRLEAEGALGGSRASLDSAGDDDAPRAREVRRRHMITSNLAFCRRHALYYIYEKLVSLGKQKKCYTNCF